MAGTIFGVNRVKDPRISWVKIEIEGRHPIRGLPELDPYPKIIMAMAKNPGVARAKNPWVAKSHRISYYMKTLMFPNTGPEFWRAWRDLP